MTYGRWRLINTGLYQGWKTLSFLVKSFFRFLDFKLLKFFSFSAKKKTSTKLQARKNMLYTILPLISPCHQGTLVYKLQHDDYITLLISSPSSSSSRACLWLEHSCFHELLPASSVLSVSPPMLSSGHDWAAASRVRSQVWCGRPGRRLQSLGNPQIDVCKALDRSHDVICINCTTKKTLKSKKLDFWDFLSFLKPENLDFIWTSFAAVICT